MNPPMCETIYNIFLVRVGGGGGGGGGGGKCFDGLNQSTKRGFVPVALQLCIIVTTVYAFTHVFHLRN